MTLKSFATMLEKRTNFQCKTLFCFLFQYALESFTETRCTTKATEGVTLGQFLEYRDEAGSSSFNMNPWDYEFEPEEEFVERVKCCTFQGLFLQPFKSITIVWCFELQTTKITVYITAKKLHALFEKWHLIR